MSECGPPKKWAWPDRRTEGGVFGQPRGKKHVLGQKRVGRVAKPRIFSKKCLLQKMRVNGGKIWVISDFLCDKCEAANRRRMVKEGRERYCAGDADAKDQICINSETGASGA